jgi:hypothetical protein
MTMMLFTLGSGNVRIRSPMPGVFRSWTKNIE